jgi:hypothetical protein
MTKGVLPFNIGSSILFSNIAKTTNAAHVLNSSVWLPGDGKYSLLADVAASISASEPTFRPDASVEEKIL